MKRFPPPYPPTLAPHPIPLPRMSTSTAQEARIHSFI